MRMKNKKAIIKFFMWFLLLSTLGVGGGIFFLLFAVVPIEEWYVQRGWSQFKIDGVMSYYVVGWVIFGFIMSFVYYFLCLKKEKWIISSLFCIASILLCVAGLNYFLNTGSSVVQASQGDVEVGERFTFGPYPEKVNLQELKDQGYDGVIALLSTTLPIEKPLLDKEFKAGEEIGIEILSMPMLPWVGDNTETLNKIRELVEQDEKKYYVHCYLGRHRVDVVKQLVNEASGAEHELLVLQSTSFERGHVYYDSEKEVIIGPFPTDEEWFTRIRRGEVKEVISLLGTGHSFREQGEQVSKEMNMIYTEMSLPQNYQLADLQKIIDYIKTREHKVFVYDFNWTPALQELEALYSFGKTIHPLAEWTNISNQALSVGAKYMVGPALNEQQKESLKAIGMEQFADVQGDIVQSYQQVKDIIAQDKLTYISTAAENKEAVYKIVHGMVYGYEDYSSSRDAGLLDGQAYVDVRNLTYGPIITEEQMLEFIIPNGIKNVLYLHVAATTSEQDLQQIKSLFEKYKVDLTVYPISEGYEKTIIPILNAEQGSNYLMTDEAVLPTVMDLLDKY